MSKDEKVNPTFQIVGMYIKDCSLEAPQPVSSYKER